MGSRADRLFGGGEQNVCLWFAGPQSSRYICDRQRRRAREWIAPYGRCHQGPAHSIVLTNQLESANQHLMMQTETISYVMRALADPTRRAVFERIIEADEITVVELTRASAVTQGAISQHLKTLKLAGLVSERPEGRKVYYRARPEGLAPLAEWMNHYGVFWRERFSDLRKLLKEVDP